MLDKIKLMLGITDATKDSLLQLLIEQATDEAKAYTHQTDVDVLENVICEMVLHKYSLLDSAGLQSESYSGVNFSYLTDYPSTLKGHLNSLRKVVMK